MLLDIVSNASNGHVSAGTRTTTSRQITEEQMLLPRPNVRVATPPVSPPHIPLAIPKPAQAQPDSVHSEPLPKLQQDEDDDFPDLLGNLEKSLEKQPVRASEFELSHEAVKASAEGMGAELENSPLSEEATE